MRQCMIKLTANPSMVFLRTTETCNLKCIQCDYHKNNSISRNNALTLEEKLNLIHDIKNGIKILE